MPELWDFTGSFKFIIDIDYFNALMFGVFIFFFLLFLAFPISVCLFVVFSIHYNPHTSYMFSRLFFPKKMLDSHYVYFASEMNMTSNRPLTVLAVASTFLGDYLICP